MVLLLSVYFLFHDTLKKIELQGLSYVVAEILFVRVVVVEGPVTGTRTIVRDLESIVLTFVLH